VITTASSMRAGTESGTAGSAESRRIARRAVILVAITAVAFVSAIPGQFVWLDHAEIEQAGYRIRDVDDFVRVITEPLDSYAFRDVGKVTSGGGYYRPLYACSISLDWWLWGPEPAWFHVQNIAWHTVLVLLLYRLGSLLAGSSAGGQFAAFWATLLFAVHPTALQSVTWISGRKDIQCAVCSLIAVLTFLTSGNRRTAWNCFVCSVALLIALGFKELAVVVPVLLTTTTVFARSETVDSCVLSGDRSRYIALCGMWLAAGGWLVWRFRVTGGLGLNAAPFAGSTSELIGMLARLWTHYVAKVWQPVWPVLSDRWPATSLFTLRGAMSAGIVMLATVWTVSAWRRRDPRMIGWLWFLIWMLPAAGLLPLRHLRAERYLYPASWGLLFCGVWYLYDLLQYHVRLRRPLAWCLAFVAVGWTAVTATENRAWHDDHSLFSQALRRDPSYLEGRLALAHWALEQNDYQAAAELSAQALAIAERSANPGYWSPLIARTNFGLALYHLGESERALKQFELAARYQPDATIVRYHIGLAAIALRDFDRAIEELTVARRQQPNDALICGNLAFALLQQQRPQECLDVLLPVLEHPPQRIVDRRNAGTALLLLNRYQAAKTHLQFVMDAPNPEPADLARLAWAHWGLGEVAAARDLLRLAVLRAPQHPTVAYVQRLLDAAEAP
jgi:Tfp pilus assembly protein PilF